MCGFDHLIGDREQNLVREDLKADVRMLIITPMQEELDFFLRSCKKKEFQADLKKLRAKARDLLGLDYKPPFLP